MQHFLSNISTLLVFTVHLIFSWNSLLIAAGRWWLQSQRSQQKANSNAEMRAKGILCSRAKPQKMIARNVKGQPKRILRCHNQNRRKKSEEEREKSRKCCCERLLCVMKICREKFQIFSASNHLNRFQFQSAFGSLHFSFAFVFRLSLGFDARFERFQRFLWCCEIRCFRWRR